MFRSLAIPALLIALTSGCGEARVPAPKLDPQASAQQALSKYDSNGDGFIADNELDKCPGLKAGLRTIDQDQDGKLSAADIKTRLSGYAESQTAYFACSCQVNLDNRPLAGATVRLIPEEFMGPAVKPAKGETDASGSCALTIEDNPTPGVNYGIYRIEVSKKDGSGSETLPARYNRETVLGDAVPGGSNPEGGIVLNLTSR